jgi:ABC-type dipeptide/oligopeptide/nickel transport system permease component
MDIAKRSVRLDDRVTASLVLGATGLFFFNIVFGPIAIALGAVAARRHRSGPDRVAALIGVALGAADLVVLAVLLLGQLRTGAIHATT